MNINKHTRRVNRFLFPFLAMTLSLLLCLIVGELCVRWFVPSSYWKYFDATEDWKSDPETGWIQKPNINDRFVFHEFNTTVDFKTNMDGLLPIHAKREKKKGTLRIMIFGDSTVVGRSIPEKDRIHVQLEEILRRRGDNVEVINAGVQGYSTDQELLLARRMIPLYKPDIVLLCVCVNDFAANSLRTDHGHAKPMFIMEEGKLSGLIPPEPSNFRIVRKGYSRLSPLILIQHSALYGYFRPNIFVLRARYQFLFRDQMMMGLPDDFYYNPSALNRLDFDLFEALLLEFNRNCKESGAKFVYYLNPHPIEVWNPYIVSVENRLGLQPGSVDRYTIDRRLRRISEENKIKYLSFIEYFIKNQSRGPFHLLPRDPHCNPRGYELTAEALTANLAPMVAESS